MPDTAETRVARGFIPARGGYSRECFVNALTDLHLHELPGFNQSFGALNRLQIIYLVKLALGLVFF